ncbi:MAG: hypothetical protein R3C39_14065 [Dehalococcoidia bacterium]
MKRMTRPLLVGLAALTLFAVACGGDSEATSTPTEAPSETPIASGTPDSSGAGGTMLANGPGLSIAEARATSAQAPLLVNGYVVADASGMRYCEVLLESFPPQCGGDSFVLEGLDLDNHPEYRREGEVTWSENQVQLLGSLEGDTFTADELALAAS